MNFEAVKMIFTVVGIVTVIYLFIAGIHEFGHVWDSNRQKLKVDEMCLLGWKDVENSGSNSPIGLAWVSYTIGLNQKFDDSFQKFWDLEFISI